MKQSPKLSKFKPSQVSLLAKAARTKAQAIQSFFNDSEPRRKGAHFTAFFCVEPGRLEWQSVLLSASLRAFCKNRLEILAFTPKDKFDQLRAATTQHFSQLRVERRVLRPSPFEPAYPHGNKILAAASKLPTRHAIFFDSDTMLTQSVNYQWLTNYELGVVPAYRASWLPGEKPWKHAYRAVGEQGPVSSVLLGNQKPSPAYYNAGFIYFDATTGFGNKWLEHSLKLDRCEDVENKRPWLDQIALPVTERSLRLNTLVLPKKYNVGMKVKMSFEHSMLLAHYRNENVINSSPELLAIADYLIANTSVAASFKELLQVLPNELPVETPLPGA